MNKQALLAHVGSMQQVAYVRPVTYREGRAGSMNAYQVKNGDMTFLALADKCLDVGELTYKGVSLHFLSKPGLTGRAHYDTRGQEAQRSIMGGLFFTAGLENICAPCTVDGKEYPMHGRLRTTPAEHCGADARWDGEEYVVTVSGEMREAELFGENLTLRRTLTTRYGSRSICIRDELENEGFRPECAMLLYHFNFGYPLVEAGTRLLLPTRRVTPRDEGSLPHLDGWARMEPPKAEEPEYVFSHALGADERGRTCAVVFNDRLGLGVALDFDKKSLPWFMEWKSTAAGDYVLGLEPANACAHGRQWQADHGGLPLLAPQERKLVELRVTVLDGAEELEHYLRRIESLKSGKEEISDETF